MKKYVCVLATNNYLDGCLVLNENLKYINSKYELLCLINENITKKTKNILDYFNINYKLIPKINYNVNYDDFEQSYFKNTFDKLSIFNLTEYEKIVYLDLDLLIVDNIDELFEYNTPAIAKDYPFKNTYNSGVMVINPNENDYYKLINIMTKKMNNKEKIGDQDIINEAFNKITTLPQTYNSMREINKELITFSFPFNNSETIIHPVTVYDKGKRKILHYINVTKPFNLNHKYQDMYSDLYFNFLDNIRKKKEEYYNNQKKELI